MDVFKFINPTHPTLFDQGEIINGLKSKLWIERYRDVCEFEFIAYADSQIHLSLPIGSLISHIDSSEVMIVENHEINSDSGKEDEIKITGRSFESFFEHRIVGSNQNWPTLDPLPYDYLLFASSTWEQAVTLIKDHITLSNLVDPDDAILHTKVISTVSGIDEYEVIPVRRGSLHARLLEILSIDDLGIKTVRPGINSPLGSTDPNLAIVVHKGEELVDEVVFSHSVGDIKSADYLWSNKNVKTAALVTGRWLERVVKFDPSGYNRRMMFIDASDLDGAYSEAPTGTIKDNILLSMFIRGVIAIASQNDVVLVKAEPEKNSQVYKYREDYSVGDIITINGPYHDSVKMRVSEYVEIEDENGESGYPTFSVLY